MPPPPRPIYGRAYLNATTSITDYYAILTFRLLSCMWRLRESVIPYIFRHVQLNYKNEGKLCNSMTDIVT